jgi:amino acid transporter
MQSSYHEGLEMQQYDGIEVQPVYHGLEVQPVHHGLEVHHQNGSDQGSEKAPFGVSTGNVYDNDRGSRLHRDLKTRQITMIALGGALGTGLLITTYGPESRKVWFELTRIVVRHCRIRVQVPC